MGKIQIIRNEYLKKDLVWSESLSNSIVSEHRTEYDDLATLTRQTSYGNFLCFVGDVGSNDYGGRFVIASLALGNTLKKRSAEVPYANFNLMHVLDRENLTTIGGGWSNVEAESEEIARSVQEYSEFYGMGYFFGKGKGTSSTIDDYENTSQYVFSNHFETLGVEIDVENREVEMDVGDQYPLTRILQEDDEYNQLPVWEEMAKRIGRLDFVSRTLPRFESGQHPFQSNVKSQYTTTSTFIWRVNRQEIRSRIEFESLLEDIAEIEARQNNIGRLGLFTMKLNNEQKLTANNLVKALGEHPKGCAHFLR